MPETIQSEEWKPCPTCGSEYQDRQIPPDHELHCHVCNELLRHGHRGDTFQAAWALASTGLVFLLLANLYPIMTFNVAGNTQSNLIITGITGLTKQGYWPVATLVFFCAIAAPAGHMLGTWYACGACCSRRRWPFAREAAHVAMHLEPWSLVPVFAIACVVAVVKLDMMGTVEWQTGILWVCALSLCSLFLGQLFDKARVRNRLEAME